MAEDANDETDEAVDGTRVGTDHQEPADDAGDSPDTGDSPGDRPARDADGTDGTGEETGDAGDSPGTGEETGDAGDSPGTGEETGDAGDSPGTVGRDGTSEVPRDVRSYDKFSKIEGGTYDRANEFIRERTYITAREWAIARLCADFRTETGVEMTKIGENLPHLVPFMTDTYSPQAVNQARASFEEKVRKAGATFLYGAMSDFFTAEELDDVMYETTEVAKFLLEVEGVDLTVEEELEAEDRISEVMRDVREHSVALRHDELECPECGHRFEAGEE